GGGEGAARSIATWRIMRRRWRDSDRFCRRSVTRFGLSDLDRGELAADGEIVVIEHERAGDAVLVKLECNRIHRNLIPALGRSVEITHGNRPTLEAGERLLTRCRVRRGEFVRHDRPT